MRDPQQIPPHLKRGEESDGFRLARLEVYNWGTFHQRVWVMSPQGGTALLTGANASGKSTLVDALLTLLVPYTRRTYNQASGMEKHRERDEQTYILGAWSKQKDTTSSQARAEYLRDRSSYSVLLAVFRNAALRRDVTLAQLLRVQEDGSIYKFFVVAPHDLNIVEHFRLTGTTAELRKELRAQKAEVYNDFAAYSRHFRQLVSVRSEKAFDLFNQIVSIKEIGGLNSFVRDHMLEKVNAQQRITQLRANFENLTRSHDAILLAKKQLEILEPLIENAKKYDEHQERIREAQRCTELVPFYIAGRKQALLEQAITTARQELEQQREQHKRLSDEIEELQKQQIGLKIAISQDEVQQQIENLKQDIKGYESQRRTKKAQADKYNGLAQRLELPIYQNEESFYSTLKRVKPALAQTQRQLKDLQDERDQWGSKRGALQESCQNLKREIESLTQRKSQIPVQNIEMREQLLDALKIEEQELPYIGELVRVRESERRWEAAIERLLHNYGLNLLVPEQHYYRVSHFLEQTHLKGRLVYHRIMGQRTARNSGSSDQAMLYNKLEIKSGSTFQAWLTAEIIDRYDYLCCETIEEFQHARRALTAKGQIKHSATLHEKDDRRALGDRTSYVLGWNNIEKLNALKEDLQEQSSNLNTLEKKLTEIEERQRRERNRQRNLESLAEFESFGLIDWRTEEQRVIELGAQLQKLEASSSVKTLREQLELVNEQVRQARTQQESCGSTIFMLERDSERYTRQRQSCQQKLQAMQGPPSLLVPITKEHGSRELTLESIDSEENNLINQYNRRINSLQGLANQLMPIILNAMNDFRQTSSAIANEVDATIEAVGQYREYYEQVKREDLPRHSRRFKDLLNENVIIDINSFKSALEQQESEIKESIDRLNTSLDKIEYTPLTYIQLAGERAHDQEVRDFRSELRACLPDVSQQRTAEANEASFQRIRTLLLKFEQDSRWTTKVTDVRNWLDFSAQELYREDGKQKNYYSDSSGKSGGQKTKLAYTILASAIAYQYGLDQEEGRGRAFRFVVVDEAFSKSDEMNARYAMELFKQLDLQLLVVTPLDKIHVIEPYIAACHYTVNTEDENDSKVYNLTIEEYYKQKEEIQAGEMVSDYAD